MHLAQLRWLEGFAAGGRWYVVGSAPAEVTVDGMMRARARRTINTLRRDHRHALDALCGDADTWLATADALVSELGQRARDEQARGKQAPDSPQRLLPARIRNAVAALAASQPGLQPLIAAAASAWVLRPDVLAAAIAWMKPRAAMLSRLTHGGGPADLRRGLDLALLAREDAAGIDALSALVVTDVIADGEQARAEVANLIHRLQGKERAAASAPARSTPAVMPWVDRLMSWPPSQRTRALALLATIDLAGALAPWRDWELAHRPRIARAEALAARGAATHGGPALEDLARVIAGIERVKQALPPSIALRQVLDAIEALAADSCELFHRAAMRLLAAMAASHPPLARVRFVVHARLASMNGDLKVGWLWEAMAGELPRADPERLLAPWSDVLAGKHQAWLEDRILDDALQRPADIQRFAGALARLARDMPVTIGHARRVGAALAGGLDIEPSVALAMQLDPFEYVLDAKLVRAAVALLGRDVPALVAPLRALHGLCDESGADVEDAIAALFEHAAATGGGWLLRGLLARNAGAVIELAQLARWAARASWPKLLDPVRPAWIAAYPAALEGTLSRLAAADPDAEATARRRIAAVLPDRRADVREAAALRARAPLGPRESRRLQNLEARIAAPRPATRAQLARLAAKLDAAALDKGAARFEAALTDAARGRLMRRLEIDALPQLPVDRTQRAVVFALVDLPAADRALAGRLLRARGGPPPWDLRDDPANRAFVARVRGRGVDLAPWLDDAPRVVKGGDGQPVELALCSDPLEVFAMGAHFNTCLSPGGGNFFSVVTNAADVNKRVLYARRDGKVVGRCLLALTDAGHLMTFEPYAHDGKLGFNAIVGQFALDLAARMRSHVATTGRVATLLGRDWYDDGAQDLVGRYTILESEAYARAVKDVSPSQFVALLEKTLGRALDDITLPVVVGTTMLEQRPDLIVPLVPHLLAQRNLPDQTLEKAARYARQIGDLDAADHLLLAPAARAPLTYSAWYWGQVLARRRPSFALARLRQTRLRGVRGWNDESGERLAVAALAFEQLRRSRQAAAFYRRAIADEPWLEDQLRPHLAALEGGTAPA